MPPVPPLSEVLATVTGALPGGGEERPGQLQMAQAVASALTGRRHLVAQAGTGTGKTLAYLLPALLAGRTVVVATATRALQDQLATADLPLVQRTVGDTVPVAFAVLKGRANYLCRQRAAEVAGCASWDEVLAGGTDPVRAADDDHGGGSPGPGEAAGRVSAGILPGLEDPAGGMVAGAGDGDGDGDGDRDDGRPGVRADAGAGPVTAAGAVPGGSTGRLASEVRQLLAWATTTSSGDRAELPFEPQPRAWAAVSVGPRECPGAFRCPSGDHCFAERARQAAAAAQIVVVNTSLYTAHLAAERAVLPDHDVVVLDEAHEVEEIVSRGLGVELTPGRLRAATVAARGLLPGPGAGGTDPAGAVMDCADRLERLLAGDDDRRLDLVGRGGTTPSGRRDAAGLGTALAEVVVLARGRVDELARSLRHAGEDGTLAARGGDPPATQAARRQRAQLAMGHLADDLAALVDPDRDQVVWVSGPARARVLRAAPVEIGPLLAGRLWSAVTGVLTSATMPPGVARHLGLPGEATDHIDVGSPFPYRATTLLYVPVALGDRRRPGSDAAAHDELVELMLAAGGRTLALFTSWRAMGVAVEAVRPRVPFPVLAQGDLPKPVLRQRFADDEATCLFATLSFWQGVDVPGRSASLVVIDRLPFPRPDDPLLQARRERAGPGAFGAVDLPRAATLLAQGAGRLVRRASDTGVVAVLDPRLATAGYRRTLLDALPPMRRTVDRDEAVAFLRRATGQAAPGAGERRPGT